MLKNSYIDDFIMLMVWCQAECYDGGQGVIMKSRVFW